MSLLRNKCNTKIANKTVTAGLGYTIGNYLVKCINFLTVPLFTRLLSTYDYGYFNTYLAYESILFLLCGLGLHASVKKAMYSYEEEFDTYNSSIILLSLLNLSVLIIIVFLFSEYLEKRLSLSTPLLFVLLFHSFGSYLLLFYNEYLSLHYQFKKYIIVSCINAVLNVTLSVLLILLIFPSERTTGRILGTAIPVWIIGFFILVYYFRRSAPRVNINYWKHALKFSLPIIPHGLSQLVLNQADRVMISQMVGVAEAGVYSFAYTIYTIVMVTSTSFNNVWTTWFYGKLKEESYDDIKKRSSEYTEAFAFFVVSILFSSFDIIKIIAERSYWSSIYCVIPIVISGFFWFIYTLQVSVEYYFEKTNVIAIGSVLVAILNIVLNYLFIPMYGYIAAAYTTLVSYIVYAVVHALIARFIAQRSLFDLRTSLTTSLLVCAAGLVTICSMESWIIRYACLLIVILFFRKKIMRVIRDVLKDINTREEVA